MKLNEGDILKFELMSVDTPPTQSDNGRFVIAFVPGESFQWSQYYNLTRSWQSCVTRRTIVPTFWLKLHNVEIPKEEIENLIDKNT